MSTMEDAIDAVLEEMQNVHYPAGPIHQRMQRYKALRALPHNELSAIYHLVESHAPGLRLKTILCYEKLLSSEESTQISMCKDYVKTNCANASQEEAIESMLQRIKEMPKEWTIVQLTPKFNVQENLEKNSQKVYTNPIYISVISCGEAYSPPFCVSVDAPRDPVNGNVIELGQEIYSIFNKNREVLLSQKNVGFFKDHAEKEGYLQQRLSMDDRLKKLVKDLQNLYLGEWRCLLVGKYVEDGLEERIREHITKFLTSEISVAFDEKILNILQCLAKTNTILKIAEVRKIVQYCFPQPEHKAIHRNVIQCVQNVYDKFGLSEKKKHPVILVVDDTLDQFPWEMMDILLNESVTRIPFLYLAYALYKEHQSTIKDGYKIVEEYENGRFLVNPSSDLNNMQKRLDKFFEYWLPTWRGISGCKPTEAQFEELLVSGDIFSYNGHGSGVQFFSMQKIQRLRINAVAFLFGCSSTKLTKLGPQTEMYGTHQMYLMACSPCIIGMLWEVTDVDTDILTTELLSMWIPSKAKVHWKDLIKTKWKKAEPGDLLSTSVQIVESGMPSNEPELLKAIGIAKNSRSLFYYSTKAALVARGIPVKIKCKS